MHTIPPSTHLAHMMYIRTYSPYHTIPPAFNPDLDSKPHTQPIPTLTKTLKYLPRRLWSANKQQIIIITVNSGGDIIHAWRHEDYNHIIIS